MAETKSPYDEVQHDPVSATPLIIPDTPIDEIVEEISKWFAENFENPAEHTPYDSAEGGYQYIWGGPYDTREIIEYYFSGDLTDEQIDEVVDSIEAEGDDWVPNIGRRQPPEDDDDQLSLPLDAVELHTRLMSQIAEAESRLEELQKAELASQVRGIGHNNPPEPILDPPASKQDLEELRAAFEVLKAQPVVPSGAGQKSSEEARSKLVTIASKIGSWTAGHANTFVGKAVEEAGKEAGKWLPRAVLGYLALKDQLNQIVETVTQWLHAVNLPF